MTNRHEYLRYGRFELKAKTELVYRHKEEHRKLYFEEVRKEKLKYPEATKKVLSNLLTRCYQRAARKLVQKYYDEYRDIYLNLKNFNRN